MTIESAVSLLQMAREGGYAVGYFESWCLASLQGVLDAAEARRAPIIIGFNGAFLSGQGRLAKERLRVYGGLAKAAAAAVNVRCAVIFNECASDAWTREAVDCGFNLVMPADPHAAPADYTRRVKAITEYAHARGAAVEAEVGELPNAEHGECSQGTATDPDVALEFVRATGIDCLAVSVGNIHVRLSGSAGLDLALLERLSRVVPVPLVLHGGTGIASDALTAAIRLGVSKVNYGTYLKQRYLAAVRRALASSESNPHRLLGLGGADDVLVAGRVAVRDAVLERLSLLGGDGRG